MGCSTMIDGWFSSLFEIWDAGWKLGWRGGMNMAMMIKFRSRILRVGKTGNH